MDKNLIQAASVLLWETYKSKEFLPVINLNKSTFYQWGLRGNVFGFNMKTGRGSALELDGHDIVYLAALVTLSNMNQPPSTGKAGFRRSVKDFTQAYASGVDDYRYCIGKSRPLGSEFMEWGLFKDSTPEGHIVDSCGGKEPGWVVLDLLDITEHVLAGLSDIYRSR